MARLPHAREGPPLHCRARSHEGAIPQFSFDLGPKSGEQRTEEGKERVWSTYRVAGRAERMSHREREQN